MLFTVRGTAELELIFEIASCNSPTWRRFLQQFSPFHGDLSSRRRDRRLCGSRMTGASLARWRIDEDDRRPHLALGNAWQRAAVRVRRRRGMQAALAVSCVASGHRRSRRAGGSTTELGVLDHSPYSQCQCRRGLTMRPDDHRRRSRPKPNQACLGMRCCRHTLVVQAVAKLVISAEASALRC